MSSCCAWGRPGRICPRLHRQLSIRREPRHHRQELPFKCLRRWPSIRRHFSCPRRIPFSEEPQLGCPLPKRLCFVWSPSCPWPHSPLPHSTRHQALLPSCLSFPTCRAQGSLIPGAGLGVALPGGISGCRAHLSGQTHFARAQWARLLPMSPAPHPLGPSACPLASPAPRSAHPGQTPPLGHPLRRNPPLAFPARHGARRRR